MKLLPSFFRKDSMMAEQDKPDKPEVPAVDAEAIKAAAVKAAGDAVNSAVADAVKSALGDALKPLADQIKGLQDGLGKAATAETVAKMVGGAVSDQLAAKQADQAKSAERDKYLAEKLKDVPKVYHGGLGNDPAKFAEEEQAIRTQLQADYKAAGIKAPDVGTPANAGSGGKVGDAIDTSKLSGVELIDLGVKQTSGQATSAPVETSGGGQSGDASVAGGDGGGATA